MNVITLFRQPMPKLCSLPLLFTLAASAAIANHTAPPAQVTLAGSLQTEAGCTENWQPSCTTTQLTAGADGIWRAAFTLSAGDWEYKAALNGSWDENYGQGAAQDGANIPLTLATDTEVRFYYSHTSHWITDNVNSTIATAVGDFQAALGCESDWSPDCLHTWLQDPQGDGLYSFTTTALPVGDYTAKVAIDESWDENYGADGIADGGNIVFSVTKAGEEITFSYDSNTHVMTIGDPVVTGNLNLAKAYWLSADTIAWNLPGNAPANARVQLHYAADASLTSSPTGVSGGQAITLNYDGTGLSDEIKAQFPHLQNLHTFKISANDLELVPAILKQQVAVSALNSNDNLIDATGLQLPGVLDDLYTYDGSLGIIFNEEIPTLKLWAPTAQNVRLHLYDDSDPATTATILPMTENPQTGVWEITGDSTWNRKFYRYQVDVFVRHTGNIESNLVTDPYTLSAAMDGLRSQIVNLNDADLKPEGWDSLSKPAYTGPTDMVIYEVHVRDFSISDPKVPEEYQGKFMAFTLDDSHGMNHLKLLAEAGLSHVHLLPTNDCSSIPENPADQQTLTTDLSVFAPDSTEQQAAINAIRQNDAFNWCYDPHHFNLPEGSYATNPDGVARILEFRAMVSALNRAGLRLVIDVVYNHTSQSLLGDKSVLDKVVPGYYHRLNAQGNVETSTCCENTASEHAMMEKFMVDSLRQWVTAYKVDGIRFDLMGHHSKANLLNVQQMLQSLTLEADGIAGNEIYVYGEGWNFGEVADNARFVQATQFNMAGTGIGTFNDRFRDAVRGGSPFDSGLDHVRNQSFINGLYLDPNHENTGSTQELQNLLYSSDRIRIGLAGSLADFTFTDHQGNTVTGFDMGTAGYTKAPGESINYIEKHDNETLFDINQYKLPLDTSAADRVRAHNLGTSLVLMAQGVPFMQAGQELLRSKSTDRNTYDAGDWFNLLDYTYQDNGWGRGLPLAQDNDQNWTVTGPMLANPALAIEPDDIQRALAHTREMLAIRQSSKLFRLETAEDVQALLRFHNTGPEQIPGLIVMSLQDDERNLDSEYEQILVLFNADINALDITLSNFAHTDLSLHPVQQASDDTLLQAVSFDNTTGHITVPGRTTAVFVSTQPAETGNEKPRRKKSGAIGTPIDAGLMLLLAFFGLCIYRRLRF